MQTSLKVLIIIALVILLIVPFVVELIKFSIDKKNGNTHKRLRIALFTILYIVVISVVFRIFADFFSWIKDLSFIQWIASKITLSSRADYTLTVVGTVFLNIAIGFAFVILCRIVGIGLKKKDLTKPKKGKVQFTWFQEKERAVIKRFYNAKCFFLHDVLKYLNPILSVIYVLLFVFYQIPAVFAADFIPYSFILTFVSASYVFPTLTLLGLWEIYFFLDGIERVKDECPQLIDGIIELKESEFDLIALDKALQDDFKDYYLCSVEISDSLKANISSSNHSELTLKIKEAVENSNRNAQVAKEEYLDCLDMVTDYASGQNLIINGNFFSEFSLYFVRYLAALMAQGDTIVFVCNSDSQIDAVYEYVKEGISSVVSIYSDDGSFDKTIWGIVKIKGEKSGAEDFSVDNANILVTSLSFLCSDRLSDIYKTIIAKIDMVVFVDALVTVNTYNSQLAVLNSKLKQAVKDSQLAMLNSDFKRGQRRDGKDEKDDAAKHRYLSRRIRYIGFDDSRVAGLDKVLKNLLSVDFKSADIMSRNSETAVRCYCFDGKPNENGRIECPQFLKTQENIGVVFQMALDCILHGAPSVTIFSDRILPYHAFAESIKANGAQMLKIDDNNVRINRCFYNPDNYSVIIAVDDGDNLPATIRRYVSMTSDTPSLVIIFSRKYLLRDYYISSIKDLWEVSQEERIPVENTTERNFARKIILGADAGGISVEEIRNLASGIPQYADRKGIRDILLAVLSASGYSCDEKNLSKYFVLTSTRNFSEENERFVSQNLVALNYSGELASLTNGRNMVKLLLNDGREITLRIPRSRLTQNFIEGQNILHNGDVYAISKVDVKTGRISGGLVSGGKNIESYQYLQDRKYRVDFDENGKESVFSTKQIVLNCSDGEVRVDDAYISAFKAPMEVVTNGYYKINPYTYTLTLDSELKQYGYIRLRGNGNGGSSVVNERSAIQTYRSYADIENPTYSIETLSKYGNKKTSKNGAFIMTVTLNGKFGPDVNKTSALVAAILNETVHAMFPSVADSVVVCPVFHGEFSSNELPIKVQPALIVENGEILSDGQLKFVIIEDCPTDLGVVDSLMASGEDTLYTLFSPMYKYLCSYFKGDRTNCFLYYGQKEAPSCFDFASAKALAGLLGDNKYDFKYSDLKDLVLYDTCDFCGKRYPKSESTNKDNGFKILPGGRKMCPTCQKELVGNSGKELNAYFAQAKAYLESAYGIELGEEYEVFFEDTSVIINALKEDNGIYSRGTDISLKSYVDGELKIHAEHTIPKLNLLELLVRELTHAWQRKNLPDLDEELAEGQIALVSVQFLSFFNRTALLKARTSYYESVQSISGIGYRRLVQLLVANPKYRNNPFLYLLSESGDGEGGVVIIPKKPEPILDGDLGLPYVPSAPDRATDGSITYFYYPRLSLSNRKLYDACFEAIKNYEPSVAENGASADEVHKVIHCILYDHPELFWVPKTYALDGEEIAFHYAVTKDEIAELQTKIDEIVAEYLKDITPEMSAYDVALRMHVKLMTNADYDHLGLEHEKAEGGPDKDKLDYMRTICGAFINGKAVCEGYARALQYLLQKCGIECAEATGDVLGGGGHAWNIVKIDGDYYYIDSTWDDSFTSVKEVGRNYFGFNYFCVTTEEIMRSRDIDSDLVDMPVCKATKANYYYHNELVIDEYDLGKLKKMAARVAKNDGSMFTFKCKDKDVFSAAFNALHDYTTDDLSKLSEAIERANKNIDSVSFTSDSNLYTFTIIFNKK